MRRCSACQTLCPYADHQTQLFQGLVLHAGVAPVHGLSEFVPGRQHEFARLEMTNIVVSKLCCSVAIFAEFWMFCSLTSLVFFADMMKTYCKTCRKGESAT